MENRGAYSAKPLDKLPKYPVTEWDKTALWVTLYLFLQKTGRLLSQPSCFYC